MALNENQKVRINMILEELTNVLVEYNVRMFYFLYDKDNGDYMMEGNLCPTCIYKILKSLKEEGQLTSNHPGNEDIHLAEDDKVHQEKEKDVSDG